MTSGNCIYYKWWNETPIVLNSPSCSKIWAKPEGFPDRIPFSIHTILPSVILPISKTFSGDILNPLSITFWMSSFFSFRVLFSNLSVIFYKLKQNTLHLARCFLLYNSYLSFPFVRPIVVEFGCRCKWEKLLFKQLNINIFKQTWRWWNNKIGFGVWLAKKFSLDWNGIERNACFKIW